MNTAHRARAGPGADGARDEARGRGRPRRIPRRAACRASCTRRVRARRRPASFRNARARANARRCWRRDCLAALFAHLRCAAAPPTPERVLELCAQVEGPAHCGRLVEAEQLKALPNLAVRDGDTLHGDAVPVGHARCSSTRSRAATRRSYALWDYWSPVNAVVLFVTVGRRRCSYAVLQRATGSSRSLPAEPVARARPAARGRRRLLRPQLRQRDHRVAHHARGPAQGS